MVLPFFVQAAIEPIIQKCLPKSHWHIMSAITKVESDYQPYAVHINSRDGNQSKVFSSQQEAKEFIKELVKKKANFDIGLTQINSSHFKPGRVFGRQGLTPFDALDPCNNLKMGAFIFSDNFRRYGGVADALSAYNTGHPKKGYENGYIDNYLVLPD